MQDAWANPFHAEERLERGVLPGFLWLVLCCCGAAASQIRFMSFHGWFVMVCGGNCFSLSGWVRLRDGYGNITYLYD